MLSWCVKMMNSAKFVLEWQRQKSGFKQVRGAVCQVLCHACSTENDQKLAEPTSGTKDWQRKELNDMSKKDESAGSWICWQGTLKANWSWNFWNNEKVAEVPDIWNDVKLMQLEKGQPSHCSREMKIDNTPANTPLSILYSCSPTNSKVTKLCWQVRMCYTTKINLRFYSKNHHFGFYQGFLAQVPSLL